MKVNDILSFLNELAPTCTACDFDNVGLIIGNQNQKVSKVLLALDCTGSAISEAISKDCQLIITHHPVIFSPLKTILEGSIPHRLIKNNISVISMHTNLDIADNVGVSETLCRKLGIENIKSITSENGFILKEGFLNGVYAHTLADIIKEKLGGTVKYVDGGKKINRLLVCSGSGGEFITDAITNGFDALITSEVKHHQFLMAEENGISIFDGGHFNTEDVVIEPLCNILSSKFKEIKFFANHQSNIKFI